MDIVDIYFKKPFILKNEFDYNFRKALDDVFIGQDSSANPVVAILSRDFQRGELCLKTEVMQMLCNIEIDFDLDGQLNRKKVHLLKLNSNNQDEIRIFLKLCQTYFVSDKLDMDNISVTFSILSGFFKQKNEYYSDKELQGLYTELYTIYYFKSKFDFARCWQSKEKLKFDFSLNSKIKLEVKSTKKEVRMHHFIHEQLTTQLYDIYILSYKLRYDDQGLSLLKLMEFVEPMFDNYPDQKLKLLRVFNNTTIDKLNEIKFSEQYTEENMKIFFAKDIPQFKEKNVSGIIDANYDCILEGICECDIQDVLTLFINSSE